MPKGHSADPERIRTLRDLLHEEPRHGRVALSGIALSYATGTAEHTGRSIALRINHLRAEHGYTDTDILRALNPPPYEANAGNEE